MRFLLTIYILLIGVMTFAQKNNFTAVKNLSEFKTKFSTASQKIESIESQFSQVKNLSMLKEKMNSKGKFYYKKVNKVRIEYTSPYEYLMVINNNNMMIKDNQKTSNYNTKSNKMMQSVNNIMLDCMRGTVYDNKEFNIDALENNSEYLLNMKPNSTIMKKMFSLIEVYLDKTDFHVIRLNMIENGGDNTLMTFTNSVLNKSISDAYFNTK
ncbi:MAG TPA: outer membrane lipoprotein carrier protein LolA [Chitinophagaceae bacterium]|nr:outer membrane lipoprotein carrier protein LolA [Chitinophagaceae bacterium]